MDDPQKEQCSNCRFLHSTNKETQFGACRRYPPQVDRPLTRDDAKTLNVANARWPRVRPYAWCGEWQSVVRPEIIEDLEQMVEDGRAQRV